MSSTNTIRVIHPYRWNGMWVFDDPDVGLVREPFVAGMPEIIDHVVRGIPNAGTGFNLIFSDRPFPGAKLVLERESEQEGGNQLVSMGGDGGTGLAVSGAAPLFRSRPRSACIDVKAVD